MSFLSIQGLTVAYAENPVLRGFSLELEKGSVYSVIGPSGCGKSTLLKAIAGIVKPRSGAVLLNGQAVDPKRHALGYSPQNYGLLDWLTIEQNIYLPENIRKTNSPHAEKVIEHLGLKELLRRYPKELSGGQQQRAALARAWLLNPEILLMDEPFSALDQSTAEKSRDLFLALWKAHKTTTLFVTHNLRDAVRMGRFVVILSASAGAAPEVVENPLFTPGARREEVDYLNFELLLNQRIKSAHSAANEARLA